MGNNLVNNNLQEDKIKDEIDIKYNEKEKTQLKNNHFEKDETKKSDKNKTIGDNCKIVKKEHTKEKEKQDIDNDNFPIPNNPKENLYFGDPAEGTKKKLIQNNNKSTEDKNMKNRVKKENFNITHNQNNHKGNKNNCMEDDTKDNIIYINNIEKMDNASERQEKHRENLNKLETNYATNKNFQNYMQKDKEVENIEENENIIHEGIIEDRKDNNLFHQRNNCKDELIKNENYFDSKTFINLYKTKKDNENFDEESSDSSDEKENTYNNKKICGIKNLGNNCYLNSGLQILASCEELVDLIEEDKFNNKGKITPLFKQAMKKLLNYNIYDPEKFLNSFCKLNTDFNKYSQNCSQSFIRTLIGNINEECINNQCEIILKNEQYYKENDQEYNNYIDSNEIYPESKFQSIFSGMTRSNSKGTCPHCHEKIENYSFNYFIDQNIYLDDFESGCKFSELLRANIGNSNDLTMECPKCNEEIQIKEETKIIKLPDILIFTLERYQGIPNKVEIQPDKYLEMKDYIDQDIKVDCTLYELFAINIRLGETADSGHEICQVKRNGNWYEINDSSAHSIKDISWFSSSYGLFYRKIKSKLKTNRNGYENTQKLINKSNDNSQGLLSSLWNSIISFFFGKEKTDMLYIMQGFYILSESNILNNEFWTLNFKNNYISKLVKEVILKIKKENKYDAYNFTKEFFRINTTFGENKEHNILDFILVLLKILNEELINNNDNIYYLKKFKYLSTNEKEMNVYNKFIENKFLKSPHSYFSGIIKYYTKGKCKCGKEISEIRFEDFIFKKIYLDNNISDMNFSSILKKALSTEENKIICEHCRNKRMKLNIEHKFIKLAEPLIFSFENNNNNKSLIYDYFIDLQNFLDDSVKKEEETYIYELFAINIRLDLENNSTHFITKIKIEGSWFEISDDIESKPITQTESICNLFYRKFK